ncbi:MAG: hypothetical protein MRY32_04470 [Rickettsiales bacterium]|nr:hypothetical protein [Rickettsiales bacterium]
MVTGRRSKRYEMEPQHVQMMLNLLADDMKDIQVTTSVPGSMALSDGPSTQRVSLASAAPTLVAQYQEKLLSITSQPPMPEMNYFGRLYVANKILDDIGAVLEARTPEHGYSEFKSIAEEIERDLFSNPDYQRHLQAFAGLVQLAFGPIDFPKGSYHVPSQYDEYGAVARPQDVPAHLVAGMEDEEIDEHSPVRPMNDGSGNFRIPLSEALLLEDVELSPTPEATRRLDQMLAFIKEHRSDLFRPASPDQIGFAKAVESGACPEQLHARPLCADDQNTGQDVDEKLQSLSQANRFIKDHAITQGQPSRAGNNSISVLDSKEAPIPGMGFAHTFLETTRRAINPCRAAQDVAKECSPDQLDNHLMESGALMSAIAQDDPDIVFTAATVRYGRSILQAHSVAGMSAGDIMKQ